MREIPLTNSNSLVFVDDEDYDKLVGMNWQLKTSSNGPSIYNQFGALPYFIWPRKDGFLIDHIDRNIFNNQKYNYRYATHSQNGMNRGPQLNNTSDYKGVTWHSPTDKWKARITVNKKQIYLGLHKTKIDAAIAYNEAAIRYHGEFACLNPIPDALSS